jgi:hypothetical protein
MSDEDIKAQCIELLTKKRGDKRYRGWATEAVERYLARGNSPEKLLKYLHQDQIMLVMPGGDFFPPQVVKL